MQKAALIGNSQLARQVMMNCYGWTVASALENDSNSSLADIIEVMKKSTTSKNLEH